MTLTQVVNQAIEQFKDHEKSLAATQAISVVSLFTQDTESVEKAASVLQAYEGHEYFAQIAGLLSETAIITTGGCGGSDVVPLRHVHQNGYDEEYREMARHNLNLIAGTLLSDPVKEALELYKNTPLSEAVFEELATTIHLGYRDMAESKARLLVEAQEFLLSVEDVDCAKEAVEVVSRKGRSITDTLKKYNGEPYLRTIGQTIRQGSYEEKVAEVLGREEVVTTIKDYQKVGKGAEAVRAIGVATANYKKGYALADKVLKTLQEYNGTSQAGAVVDCLSEVADSDLGCQSEFDTFETVSDVLLAYKGREELADVARAFSTLAQSRGDRFFASGERGMQEAYEKVAEVFMKYQGSDKLPTTINSFNQKIDEITNRSYRGEYWFSFKKVAEECLKK